MNKRIYYSQEAEQQARRQMAMGMAMFVIIGGTLGALIALLLAPNSGEKTRRELSKAFNEGAEASRDATQDTVHRLEKEFADLRERIEKR
jgi:gas vesicle protein